LTEALSQHDFHEQNMHKLNLYYVTLTNYDETYQNVVYNKDNITETLGEVLERVVKNKLNCWNWEISSRNLLLSEVEEPFIGESRI
jgi:2,3-bisphosphoglycerate-independent phosphoglycerate mutase